MTDNDKRKKRLEAVKRYTERNREKVLARRKEHYQRNKKELQEKARDRYHKNRDQNLQTMKLYKKENAAKVNFLNKKRSTKRSKAMPPWLTKLDLDHIAMFYEAAADQKQYGLNCHVDHIIPLQGKEVCGLHVPWNLQVLPASENISKGNRL